MELFVVCMGGCAECIKEECFAAFDLVAWAVQSSTPVAEDLQQLRAESVR